MKGLVLGILTGIVLTTTIFISIAAFAQDGVAAFVRPLVVDVQQVVPIVADVILPLDNGTTVTATVPLTVNIALQVSLSGVVSNSVKIQEETEPTVEITEALPSEHQSTSVSQDEKLIYDKLSWTVSAEKPSFKVGDDVKVDEVRWKLIEVKDEGQTLKSGNQLVDDKKTSGKFLRINFEMENLSKEMLTFVGIDLVDNQGREFKPLSDAFMFVPDEQRCALIENLNPNLPKTCQLIFEVPANAEKIQAKVGDLKMLGSAEELIDLGL